MELKRDGKTIRRYRVALGSPPNVTRSARATAVRLGPNTVDARIRKAPFTFRCASPIPTTPTRRMPRRWASRRAATSTSTAQPNGWRKLFVGHPAKDWTTGCVAVTDAEIREVWSLVPTGARVVIHP